MSKLTLREPIWYGGKHCAGIATFRVMGQGYIDLDIIWTAKSGERLYPDPFRVSKQKVRSYPTMPVPSNPNIKVHVVPIKDIIPEEENSITPGCGEMQPSF